MDLDITLIEALCLAHDIGHPPFGHGGEVALNYMMRDHGGFEGNGQTFRIVTRLEPYTAAFGMDLSRRTLLGLVKYPNFIENLAGAYNNGTSDDYRNIKASDWHPPKGLFSDDVEAYEWLLAPLSDGDKTLFTRARPPKTKGDHQKTQFKSFDCSIMELADDIAYSIHDLEDAIVMGIVDQRSFDKELVDPVLAIEGIDALTESMASISQRLFSEFPHERKNAIGSLVNIFITNIDIIKTREAFNEPLLRFNAAFPKNLESALNVFKQFVFKHVIKKSEIQQLEYKGQLVVMELFNTFSSDPERLLPENTQKRWHAAKERGAEFRVVADYISGMTDEFASRMHGNLFLPKMQGLNNGQFY